MSPSDLPPLDCHAHVAPDVTARQVDGLGGAFVFCMTRTPAEADVAAPRADPTLLWGWGAHPGLPDVVIRVTSDTAARGVERHALIGEVGLDRRGPVGPQQAAFEHVLAAAEGKPVLLSVHSTGRTREVLRLLSQRPHPGTILHWFNGAPDEIEQAVELGFHFSVNNAMSDERLALIPRHRMLPETDFPASRRAILAGKPGDANALERRLAARDGSQPSTVRAAWYRNLRGVAAAAHVTGRLPAALQSLLRDPA